MNMLIWPCLLQYSINKKINRIDVLTWTPFVSNIAHPVPKNCFMISALIYLEIASKLICYTKVILNPLVKLLHRMWAPHASSPRLLIEINLMERKAKVPCLKWNIIFHRELNNYYFALLIYLSQGNLMLPAVCHIVTLPPCSGVDIWKRNFLQCCV